MIIVTDITILFSDLASLIVPLQTWNVKYYKYAIIKKWSEITTFTTISKHGAIR